MGLFDGTSLERPVTCERCQRALDACGCPRDASSAVLAPKDQPVRVQREKRRGKWTTVVYGLDASANDLSKMLKGFKSRFGAGGKVTDDGFEIQGDHRDTIIDELKSRGFPAKASGG